MVMHGGNHNPHTIDWQVFSEVTEHKDLGVVFDDVLKFHSHVFTIVSKANRTLGMIKKCFTALNHSTSLVFYKTWLEHNTVILFGNSATEQMWLN